MNGRHLKTGFKRRWYDSVPQVAHAIEVVEQMPPSIQQMVIQSLNDYINHYRRYRRAHDVSVGVTTIMGLYNATRRSRWYDSKPKMRRAFNMMATVPARVLSIFSTQVLDISDVVAYRAGGKMSSNSHDIAAEVNAMLKETYDTIVEDARGMKLTDVTTEKSEDATARMNDPLNDPHNETIEGVIIVPNNKARRNRSRR